MFLSYYCVQVWKTKIQINPSKSLNVLQFIKSKIYGILLFFYEDPSPILLFLQFSLCTAKYSRPFYKRGGGWKIFSLYFDRCFIQNSSKLYRFLIVDFQNSSKTYRILTVKNYSYRKLLVKSLKIHRVPIIDGSSSDEAFFVSFRLKLIFFHEFPMIVLSSFHLTPMNTFSLVDQLLLVWNFLLRMQLYNEWSNALHLGSKD